MTSKRTGGTELLGFEVPSHVKDLTKELAARLGYRAFGTLPRNLLYDRLRQEFGNDAVPPDRDGRPVDRTPLEGVKHGKYTSYSKYGCRCVDCLNAQRAYYQKRRARRRAKENGTNE